MVSVGASALFQLHNDLRALALPGVIHHRVLRTGVTVSAATAMRIAREAEFAPLKFSPKQQKGGYADDDEGNQLLPVHGPNITSNPGPATDDLFLGSSKYCRLVAKMV